MRATNTQENCRAIVVDDEHAIVEVVACVLEQNGILVHRACSGEKALEIMASNVIDIVISDICMDGMTGFELMKCIHIMDSAVKVIVMTAYDSYDMVRRALQAGAYDYLDKPLNNPDAIVSAAMRAYESSRLIRENTQLLENLHADYNRLATINIRLVALNRQLRSQAITDSLTKIYNRRYIDQALQEEASRCKSHKHPLSIFVLDVDNFKAFNDQHGHDGGDAALIRVAQVLKKYAKKNHIVGRYGGEEFIVLLPMTPPECAQLVAEQVRHDIEADSVELENGTGRLTVSIGIASVTGGHRNITGRELIIEADKALYAAKNAGRNRVSYFEDLTTDQKGGSAAA